MSKFYTQAWKQRAMTYLKLIEAAPEKIDAVKIYKEGKNTNDIYEREITTNDYMREAGYRAKVWSQDEKKAKDTDSLNKLNLALANMPTNPKLREIANRKFLEFADLTPDEITDIMLFEKQNPALLPSGTIDQAGVQGQPPPTPVNQPTQ